MMRMMEPQLNRAAMWLGEVVWQVGRQGQWLWRRAARVPAVAWFLVIVALVYAGVAGRDFHWYQYLINPDGISYMDIARLWARGQWWAAVNPYWGPLLSWLMVPVMAAGAPALVAAKVVNLVVGAGLLVGVLVWARRYSRPWVAMAVTVLMVPLVWAWTLGGYVTPDLLLVALLVWYWVVLTSPWFERRWWLAVVAGLLVGMAYLAKSYALPFFVLHFGLYMAWQAWRHKETRRTWEKRFLLGMAGFLVVALPWIVAISIKNHKFTYGTSGAYTLALVGRGSSGHPVLNDGLIAPPPGGTSAWIEPVAPAGPTGAPSLFPPHNLRYARDQVAQNLQALVKLLGDFWPLALGVLVAAVALALRRGDTLPARAKAAVKFMVATGLLYISGYLIIFVEDRYMWPVEVMLVIMAGVVVEAVWRDRRFPRLVVVGMLALGWYTLTLQTNATMQDRQNANADIPVAAHQIAATPGYDCRSLASNAQWEISSYMAFYLGCPYYGMFGPYDIAKTGDQLNKYQVEYVLMWHTGDKKRDKAPLGYGPVGKMKSYGITVLKRGAPTPEATPPSAPEPTPVSTP